MDVRADFALDRAERLLSHAHPDRRMLCQLPDAPTHFLQLGYSLPGFLKLSHHSSSREPGLYR
jgi:hypothetical protein